MKNNNLFENKYELSAYAEQSELFSKKAAKAKGKNTNCFCTCCANPINLHEKMPGGYCDKCGEYVSLRSALRCELSEEAILRMDEIQLYGLEKKFGTIPPVATLEDLAERNHVPSCNLLALYYFKQKDYDSCCKYSEISIQKKDGDGAFYFAAGCCRSGELINAVDYSNSLEIFEMAKNDYGFKMPETSSIYEKEYKYAKERYETLAARERASSYTSGSDYSSDYSSGYSSASSGISDKDWDDFTFMNGIIDRMHNDPAWGDDTRVSDYDPYSHDPESFPADTECFPDSSQIW